MRGPDTCSTRGLSTPGHTHFAPSARCDVAAALAGISWWRICSSDLVRCRQTTKLILTTPPSDSRTGCDSDLDDSEQKEGEPVDGPATHSETAADGLLHVGSHIVRLDPRLREMSAGIYEGLPRGTAYKEAVRIKADEAGLSVEALTARGSIRVHEDPAQFRARASSFLDWVIAEYLQELADREELGEANLTRSKGSAR